VVDNRTSLLETGLKTKGFGRRLKEGRGVYKKEKGIEPFTSVNLKVKVGKSANSGTMSR